MKLTKLREILKAKWDAGKIRGLYVPNNWSFQDFMDYLRFSAIIERKAIRKREKQNKKAEVYLNANVGNLISSIDKGTSIITKSYQNMLFAEEGRIKAREKLFSDIDNLVKVGNFAIVKQDVKVPKVSDYDPEDSSLVQRVKVILAKKMLQLKKLLKDNPFAAKSIYNQLNALNKFVEKGNYKQAIIFINDLIARVERIIADEEGKVAALELTKAEKDARANIVSTMDTLVERLNLDESILLGKDDGLGPDHFGEEEDEEEEEQVKKEYFSEEEAKKREREKKRIREGKYAKKPKPGKVSKPPKIKQIGIGKPLWDQEERGIVEQVPEPEVLEEIEDKVQTLEESFRELTEEQRQDLLTRLFRRKMKEVEN